MKTVVVSVFSTAAAAAAAAQKSLLKHIRSFFPLSRFLQSEVVVAVVAAIAVVVVGVDGGTSSLL